MTGSTTMEIKCGYFNMLLVNTHTSPSGWDIAACVSIYGGTLAAIVCLLKSQVLVSSQTEVFWKISLYIVTG